MSKIPPINDRNIILIEVDDKSQMASVSLNGQCVMEGNFWDFHPGCTGQRTFGDFNGYIDLSRAIYQWLVKIWKVDFRLIQTIKKTYLYAS